MRYLFVSLPFRPDVGYCSSTRNVGFSFRRNAL